MLLNQKAFAKALVESNMDKTLNRSSKSALTINQDSETNDDEELPTSVSSTYRSIIGAIGYLANTTRPDLLIVFSILGMYVCKPTNKSWRLAQYCLSYIKETLDLGLMFKTKDQRSSEVTKMESELKTESVSTHRNLRSGTHVTLYGGTIDWKFKLQSVISLSSTEAEYYAANLRRAHCISEYYYMRSKTEG